RECKPTRKLQLQLKVRLTQTRIYAADVRNPKSPSPAFLRERASGATVALFSNHRDARVRVLSPGAQDQNSVGLAPVPADSRATFPALSFGWRARPKMVPQQSAGAAARPH